MKKALKYTSYTLLSFILLILLYLACAWALYHITVAAEPISKPEISIYLKSNGVHSDVVVPIKTEYKDWSRSILYKYTLSNDTAFNYIAFGWGDKGFYLETPTWNDLKASTAFKAAFGLSSPAVHATYYKQIKLSKRCIRLVITKEQYIRLINYIETSLQTNTKGQPQVVATSVRYGKHDAFYEAKGSYHLFHTCNTWTNDALKACGQKACWWTPFDKGIFYQYR
jgi:uncharacterized protein (TIGR02117 family)